MFLIQDLVDYTRSNLFMVSLATVFLAPALATVAGFLL